MHSTTTVLMAAYGLWTAWQADGQFLYDAPNSPVRVSPPHSAPPCYPLLLPSASRSLGPSLCAVSPAAACCITPGLMSPQSPAGRSDPRKAQMTTRRASHRSALVLAAAACLAAPLRPQWVRPQRVAVTVLVLAGAGTVALHHGWVLRCRHRCDVGAVPGRGRPGDAGGLHAAPPGMPRLCGRMPRLRCAAAQSPLHSRPTQAITPSCIFPFAYIAVAY